MDAQKALLPPLRAALLRRGYALTGRVARFGALLAFVVCATGASGCGPVWYTAEIISAESIVSEAEHSDAAELSPYEYYLAREYLVKAREQASEASYEDAVHYAQEAHRAGALARDQARSRLREDDTPRASDTTQAGTGDR